MRTASVVGRLLLWIKRRSKKTLPEFPSLPGFRPECQMTKPSLRAPSGESTEYRNIPPGVEKDGLLYT
jgi:hypothetical protein